MNKIYKRKKYHPFEREMRTIAARREACAFPEFTRPKRQMKNLPNPWEVEKSVCWQRSWKFHTHFRKPNGIDANKIRALFKCYDPETLEFEEEL